MGLDCRAARPTTRTAWLGAQARLLGHRTGAVARRWSAAAAPHAPPRPERRGAVAAAAPLRHPELSSRAARRRPRHTRPFGSATHSSGRSPLRSRAAAPC
eukprot:scaffold76400_cov69-Phaeocystis_antarctica.AAC.3